MSRFTLGSGEPWSRVLKSGSSLRITDIEGQQAVDVLFYNAHNPLERYSATETIHRAEQFLRVDRDGPAVR